jgi:hypothetical protein
VQSARHTGRGISPAKADFAKLISEGKASADRAVTEMQQAMQTADVDGTIPTDIDEIFDRLKAVGEAILSVIEAEFD